MQWLARREHSSHELHAKLVRKGCAPEVAAEAIERLRTERLVSDERFIEGWIRARKRRGVGPLRVRQELQEKGISKEKVEQWLDARGREWIELLKQVRCKKFGARPPKNYSERAKQARFLQYRGFGPDQIQQVLSTRDID